MDKVDSRWRGWAPRLLSILRIITALLLMQHGADKLFNFLGGSSGGPPPLFTQMWIGGVLEFFGGLLVLLGLFTSPVAFVLSGMMAVAYFQFHAPRGFWPLQNRGELAALYCFVFLYLSAAGGGPWSLDSVWRRKAYG
jgi:putative oxidoreductase